MLKFTVIGHPETAGSKKAFVRKGRAIIADDNAKSRGWKTQVSERAFEEMGTREPTTSPLLVILTFFVQRPAGHYGTGKNAANVKDSAPRYPASRPDVLKLSRAVEDAMTSIVYRDDAQIVDERIVKKFGTPERVEIEIVELT